ncbi:MAG: hypothetical protein ACIAQZ_12530 [Sedimentisphaeraceae bacterium JB056]
MKKNILAILLLPVLLLTGGCGIVSVLGTPSASEEVVEAKFDISQRYGEKILVLVNQPSWVNSPVNLRKEITNKVNSYMRVYFEDLPEDSIIEYDTVKEKRSSDMDFDNRDVVELAEMFDAGVVLYIELLEFDILRLTSQGYYSAEMKTFSVLYDGKDGSVLWPETKAESVISLGIECEKGVEQTMVRLSTAAAHCTLRNFYDCLRHKYKVIEEKRQYEMDEW